MDRIAHQRITPSLGVTLERTIDLAQKVASDEFQLLQVEVHDRVSDAVRSGAWFGFGALCLVIAWIVAWAAAVVALEGRFSLETRLGMLAILQFVIGAALIGFGMRSRDVGR